MGQDANTGEKRKRGREKKRRRRDAEEKKEKDKKKIRDQPLLLFQVLVSLDLSWLVLGSPCLHEIVGTAPKALLWFTVYKLLQLPKHSVLET